MLKEQIQRLNAQLGRRDRKLMDLEECFEAVSKENSESVLEKLRKSEKVPKAQVIENFELLK